VKIYVPTGPVRYDVAMAAAIFNLTQSGEHVDINVVTPGIENTEHLNDVEKICIGFGEQWDIDLNNYDYPPLYQEFLRPDGSPSSLAGAVWREMGAQAIQIIAKTEFDRVQIIQSVLDREIFSTIDHICGSTPLLPLGGATPPEVRAIQILTMDKWGAFQYSALQDFGRQVSRLTDYLHGAIIQIGDLRPYPELIGVGIIMENVNAVVYNVPPEALYIAYHDKPRYLTTQGGVLECLPVAPGSNIPRAPFPEEWWGKSGEELTTLSLIPEAVYCDSRGIKLTVKSKDNTEEHKTLTRLLTNPHWLSKS